MKANLDSSLAIDAAQLSQLKAQAKQNSSEALKAAAQQFEAVFLNMMLKSMRESSSQESLFDNDQSRMFTGMLDQQLSQNLAGKGVGLADMLIKQLSPQGQMIQPASPANVHYLAQSAPAPTINELSQPTPSLSRISTPSTSLPLGNTQQQFIQKLLPEAQQVSRETGVPVQLLLGQAALESGWGKREIQTADGRPSFNLFGIKATGGWQGSVSEVMTTEYRNGIAYKQPEKFRAYDSYAESLRDYANLMTKNPRYAAVLQQPDLKQMAQQIQQAGYATDPRYAVKLGQVMAMLDGQLSLN